MSTFWITTACILSFIIIVGVISEFYYMWKSSKDRRVNAVHNPIHHNAARRQSIDEGVDPSYDLV